MVRKSANLFFAMTSYVILGGSCGTGARFDHVSDEFNTCLLAKNIIEQENHRTVELSFHSLPGKWVSQTCETRSESPYKHLLRSYTFYSNNSFNLVQIFYEDEFCSSATYAISVFGYLHAKHKLYGKRSHYLTRGTIVLHDIATSKRFSQQVNNACPNTTARFWKPHTEYEIYNRDRIDDSEPKTKNGAKDWLAENQSEKNNENGISYTESDSQCLLFSLDIVFGELDNLKIYKRPFRGAWKTELFLAKEHSGLEHRRPMVSNSFQPPLVLYNESFRCSVCAAVAASSLMFVPVFYEKPKLFPPSLMLRGGWISERCEPVPQMRLHEETFFELFATKNLRLDSTTMQWELEIRYYSESSCAILLAEHESYGVFSYRQFQSEIVPGATNVDFETEKSLFLLWSSSLLKKVREDPSCGYTNYWEVGVKVELLTPCSSIRFSFLNRRNIMKIETDERGEEILYLGEDEELSERPTAFGYPLVKCDMQAVWKFWSPDSSASTLANWFLIFAGLFILSGTG